MAGMFSAASDRDYSDAPTECVDCGEPATTTAPYYTGPDTYVDDPVCAVCAEKRDNAEPPDPDGEDIFRDRDAESRDSMRAAQRLK